MSRQFSTTAAIVALALFQIGSIASAASHLGTPQLRPTTTTSVATAADATPVLPNCFHATNLTSCLIGSHKNECVWAGVFGKCQFECGQYSTDKTQCQAHSSLCRWVNAEQFCAPSCDASGLTGDHCYQLAGCGWNVRNQTCFETKCNRHTKESECSLLKCTWLKDGGCTTSYCASQSLATCMTATVPQMCWVESDNVCSTNSCFEIFDETACNANPYGCQWLAGQSIGAPFANPNGTCVSGCNGFVNIAGCALSPHCYYNFTAENRERFQNSACVPSLCQKKKKEDCTNSQGSCYWEASPLAEGGQCVEPGHRCPSLLLNEASCAANPNCLWDTAAAVCLPFIA